MAMAMTMTTTTMMMKMTTDDKNAVTEKQGRIYCR